MIVRVIQTTNRNKADKADMPRSWHQDPVLRYILNRSTAPHFPPLPSKLPSKGSFLPVASKKREEERRAIHLCVIPYLHRLDERNPFLHTVKRIFSGNPGFLYIMYTVGNTPVRREQGDLKECVSAIARITAELYATKEKRITKLIDKINESETNIKKDLKFICGQSKDQNYFI